jgi:tetratricopeptide (TPR) repeat protein
VAVSVGRNAPAAAAIYTPRDAATVVTKVPPRDPRETAARQELAANPDRIDLAVALARTDIQRGRALSDPRYLGRAQATLGRWWKLAAPPADVLILRATIEQSLHDFTTSRADLDALIARDPGDAQAHLTRAVVATVTADYPAARASCDAVAHLAAPIVAAACSAPLEGVTGHADEGYAQLARAIHDAPRADPALREWALTALSELAVQRGDLQMATEHVRAALALDGEDAYALALLADLQLLQGHPADASTLLAGREQIDNLLMRRAIAEVAAHGPDAGKLVDMMRARIAAAAERGDRIHMREEARFVLEVEQDAHRAVTIARANWAVQKELADARLLAASAVAAHDPAAAAPVIEWARTNGVHDAQLDRSLQELAR